MSARWIIEPFGGMKVPGILYTSERMIKEMGKHEARSSAMSGMASELLNMRANEHIGHCFGLHRFPSLLSSARSYRGFPALSFLRTAQWIQRHSFHLFYFNIRHQR